MIDLITLGKQFVAPHIRQGGAAVDFTMGNGNDTLWLSKAVGDDGRVYAFDIQQQAYDNTAARLEANGRKNCTLILDSHERVLQYVHEPICAGMFNLGYLPGADKHLYTLRPSTAAAVEGGLSLLADDGILLIAVYPGHKEGELEGEMLRERLSQLDRHGWCVSFFRIINSPTAPYFIIVEKA